MLGLSDTPPVAAVCLSAVDSDGSGDVERGLRVGPVLITAHCDSAPRVAASCGPAFHACWWPTGSNQRSARALSFAFMHARRVETSRTPTKTHASALTSTHATALGRGQRAHARVRARAHTRTRSTLAHVTALGHNTNARVRAHAPTPRTHVRTRKERTCARTHTREPAVCARTSQLLCVDSLVRTTALASKNTMSCIQ